jgi:hypothetical protein
MSVKVTIAPTRAHIYEAAMVIHVDETGHLILSKRASSTATGNVAIIAPGSWTSAEVIPE